MLRHLRMEVFKMDVWNFRLEISANQLVAKLVSKMNYSFVLVTEMFEN